MNVFVLCTGRCGSETFARACAHMSNFSVAHESGRRMAPAPYASLRYPEAHIEVDNRLAWFLGGLDREYGDRAFYVHLVRDGAEVSRSLADRGRWSILFSFASGVLQYADAAQFVDGDRRREIGLQYWQTVNENIELFLRDKTRKMTLQLHEMPDAFEAFWRAVGAEGDLAAALSEWKVAHNASPAPEPTGWTPGRDDWSHRLALATERLLATVAPGEPFALVDDGQLTGLLAPTGRHGRPFHDADAGPPADDAAALAALERLRAEGTAHLAFAWPAFWWLERYPELARTLRSRHRCVSDDDLLLVFDLR